MKAANSQKLEPWCILVCDQWLSAKGGPLRANRTGLPQLSLGVRPSRGDRKLELRAWCPLPVPGNSGSCRLWLPLQEGDSLGAMEKLCRQLTYHLSPHSQWRRHRGLVKRKPQACLKAVLAGSPPDNTVDLSGIPLTSRDLERVTSYLQRCGEQVDSVELGFTGLTDDMVLQLLPALSTLPRLTTLALNGNRLTRALLHDLTDTLKDPSKFPNVTWIDLGNNVDIFSLPQPFLLSLRKRSPKQGHLPTILELGEGPGSGEEARDETVDQEDPGGGSLDPAKDLEGRETVGAVQT